MEYLWIPVRTSKMLKSSRTWPSILTMAVVQLKFDQKGKYSYSSIAPPLTNNNNETDMASNEITNDDEVVVENCNLNTPNQHYHSDDNHKSCRKEFTMSSTTNSTQTRSLSSNFSSLTSPAHNPSVDCPSKNPTKFCLCELEFRENRTKRSHSIKVDNWELIYKENPLNAPKSKELIMNGHGNYPKWVNVWSVFHIYSFSSRPFKW